MVAVLITGMSGAGKSTALAALRECGYEIVDTDVPGWIEVVEGEPLWREDRMRDLLPAPRAVPLFVGGTVANQGRFRDGFDAVVLLTAPLEVLLERLRHRDTNDFGKLPHELEAVLVDHRAVEPRLRSVATHVLDTSVPVAQVVAALEAIAGQPSGLVIEVEATSYPRES